MFYFQLCLFPRGAHFQAGWPLQVQRCQPALLLSSEQAQLKEYVFLPVTVTLTESYAHLKPITEARDMQ